MIFVHFLVENEKFPYLFKAPSIYLIIKIRPRKTSNSNGQTISFSFPSPLHQYFAVSIYKEGINWRTSNSKANPSDQITPNSSLFFLPRYPIFSFLTKKTFKKSKIKKKKLKLYQNQNFKGLRIESISSYKHIVLLFSIWSKKKKKQWEQKSKGQYRGGMLYCLLCRSC